MVVSWEPVSEDLAYDRVVIVGYQVIVVEDAAEPYPQGFAAPERSVYLPPSVTEFPVPDGFLADNRCYKYEVS